jgi:hypothetical protein
VQRQQGERHADDEEQSGKYRRRPGQSVRRAARTKKATETRPAAAHAECAAFGPLQQYDDNKRGGDEDLQNHENDLKTLHGMLLASGRLLDERTPQEKGSRRTLFPLPLGTALTNWRWLFRSERE